MAQGNERGEANMRKAMTQREIKDEVTHVAEHLEEIKMRQQAERKAYFDNPENAERIMAARQRLAISEQLYNARKKAGLTQTELARRMNVSQPMIARLELVSTTCGMDGIMRSTPS